VEQARWSVRYYFGYPPGKEENYKSHVRLAESRWRIEMGTPRRKVHRYFFFKCFVDRASRYIRVMKTNWMHYLSSVYFVSQPLHVSGMSVVHHQEVKYIYNSWYVLCFSVDCLLANRQKICPQYVEVDWRNKLRINSTSRWFSLHGSAQMSLRHKPAQPGLQTPFLCVRNCLTTVFVIKVLSCSHPEICIKTGTRRQGGIFRAMVNNKNDVNR